MTVLERLSRRERILLLLLFLVALPLALWALVVVPLQETRSRAVGALAVAQADYIWVAEQAQRFEASTPADASTASPPAGIAGLEAALIESALRDLVTSLEAAPDGGIRLQMSGVQFDLFGRFIDDVSHVLGYHIIALRIMPVGDPGLVNASLELTPL